MLRAGAEGRWWGQVVGNGSGERNVRRRGDDGGEEGGWFVLRK